MNLVGNGLIIAGTSLLVFSLVPAWKLMKELPPGELRRRWGILVAMVLLFVPGYIIYGSVARNGFGELVDLLVPAVFFSDAVFVLLVTTISLQTSVDVRRITILEHENVTDPLTGIYNRRYLDRRLKDEVRRAHRYGFPLSVLLLDIDHFKQLNDQCGHQFGDVVLKAVSQTIAQSARASDVVARYGGEEILVIATNTSVGDAIHLGERLRSLIEKMDLDRLDHDVPCKSSRTTVSVGVAGLSDETSNEGLLIENADSALYQAKREGRNRVVAASTT
jgi:diguanylate cyclase (GGDEF)-like protein